MMTAECGRIRIDEDGPSIEEKWSIGRIACEPSERKDSGEMAFSYFMPPVSSFESRSLCYRLIENPLLLLVQLLYGVARHLQQRTILTKSCSNAVRVLCISDTHSIDASRQFNLPPADILIHAGDLTNGGTVAEIQEAINWIQELRGYRHKIVIAGNHDSFFDENSRRPEDRGQEIDFATKVSSDVIYLRDELVELDVGSSEDSRKIRIYGAPHIPACGGKDFAFQYPRGQDIWSNTIPRKTDILVTHTPPKWHLDLSHGMGCEALLAECWRVRPRLHIFGHIHCGHGQESVDWDERQKIYEKLCSRLSKPRSWLSRVLHILNMLVWVDIISLVCFSVRDVVRTRFGGANEKQNTLMVNAAAMRGSSGRLGNQPHLVVI